MTLAAGPPDGRMFKDHTAVKWMRLPGGSGQGGDGGWAHALFRAAFTDIALSKF